MSEQRPAAIDKRVLYNGCMEYLDCYIRDIVAIQKEVFVTLKNEFTYESVCEPTSSPKYLAVISKIASVTSSKEDLYKSLIKCYALWKDKLEPKVRDSTKKHTYAELPLRLAACFFLNGDYYKALMCLRHSIILESRNLLPRILALRWSAFLGEWEMAEMALAFEKAKETKTSQKGGNDDYVGSHLIFIKDLVKSYIEFNRDQKSRSNSGSTLLKMTHNVNADTRTTFLTFEAQSFANWMCSHIPKVAANFSLDDVEPIDSFNCLHRAVVKSESVMKNRIIGIQKEAEPLDFMKVSSDACDFLKACASFAESCELRREFSIELLNVGMVHDAAFHSQLGLWCAMKLGVLFRIQQFVNLNTLIRQCVVQIEFKNDLQYCLDIMRTMYLKKFMSKSGSGCFLKEKDDNLFGSSNDLDLPLPYTPTSTPHFPSTSVGQKSVASSIMESFEDLRLEQTKISSCRSNTIASKLIDSFQELTLTDATCSLHELSARCDCKTCGLCKTNYNAAFEYWFSSFLYASMSDCSIQNLTQQFHKLRSRVAEEQCAVLGKKVKPRPPSSMCETFAMCVVRWLRRLEEICWDRENKVLKSLRESVIAGTVKICSYSSIRTISYRLAISQLERVQNIRRSPRYQWMADDSRTNKIMNTMKQYIFPSRLCRNVDAKDLDDSIDSVEQNGVEKAIVDGALSEYTLHSDLLYRDWRFPLCTFLGEHVTCPWLAAMMWSESTLLATRQLSRHLSGQLKGLTFSEPSIFQEMVVNLPEDFTLIHLALSHDGSLHLIKMHKDREPIIMPLAPKSKVENVKAMMEKIIDENTRTCNLGKTTKDAKAFWAARRAVDADLKNLIPRVQDILLGAAAPLLLPSISITRKGITVAKCLVAASQCSNGAQLPLSFAKELVSLATKIERTEWIFVVERMCDVLGISSRKENIQDLYLKTRTSALNIGLSDNSPSYTFLIVCPDLTTIPWEVVPILDGATYVARVPSVHAFFQALSSSKQVPIAVNIQKAFYVLDPDNNLGETQKRIKNYVSKFGWQGIVGKIPSTAEVTEALRQQDVFFYMGHGSGSRYFGRRTISESTINAVSVLMGCGSVRLTTLGWGMDGKSSVYDYSVARCPSVVGCLWTVTDGEIDRYFMALVDLCFSSDANRTLTGAEGGDTRLRLLVEAMKKAKGRCKLPYLTGAAVVSYGIPVVASE